MTRPYSVDLRDRVVAFVESGHSRHQAAVHFQVSGSFVVKLMRAFRSSGRIEARPIGGRRHAKRDAHRVYPVRRMEEKDDITMSELAADLLAETGTQAAPASLSRWFLRNGYSVKKSLLASEQDRVDVRQAREEWINGRQPRMRLNQHRLIFLDETGTTTKMTRMRGRC